MPNIQRQDRIPLQTFQFYNFSFQISVVQSAPKHNGSNSLALIFGKNIELSKLDMLRKFINGNSADIAAAIFDNEPATSQPSLVVKPPLEGIVPPPLGGNMRAERNTFDMKCECLILHARRTDSQRGLIERRCGRINRRDAIVRI